MSRRLSESGQTTALMLVGFMLMAILAGLAVAQGLSTTAPEQSTIPTVTPPSLITPTPTSTATETPTPTATPTPGDDNTTDGDNTSDGDGTTGQTHFVNAGVGPADGVTSDEGCSAANYRMIQAAVDAADPGDTVAVCPGTYGEHVRVTTANLTITAADRVTQAGGDVTITNANESAVWINAPGVTLQGFNISVSGGADYAIEVGGKNAIIRGNTVKSPLVGIFLSDGNTDAGECRVNNRISSPQYMCDGGPPVDPDLRAATGGRVLNNTVEAGMLRIWVDADQTVVQNNFVTNYNIPNNAQNYPECRGNSGFSSCHDRFNDSIVSSGNDSIIRKNVIQIEKEVSGIANHGQSGIMIGKTPTEDHNMATNNTVVGNSIYMPGGFGIMTRNVSDGTKILNNTLERAVEGVRVANEALIRNNKFFAGGPESCGGSGGIVVVSFAWAEVPNAGNKEVRIINNTFDGHGVCLGGMRIAWKATIKGNTIKNIVRWGIRFSLCRGGEGRVVNNQISGVVGKGFFEGHAIKMTASDYKIPCPGDLTTGKTTILNNQITNNGYGITLQNDSGVHPRLYDIQGNLINNNQELGIYNQKESKIVDATNNIWGCGGPSGGADPLADPYTGRLANGSGDLISAGNGSKRNGHEISNVHFDPFQVVSGCPSHTPSASPTPTPTPTPTLPPAGGGSGDGGGGGGPSTGSGSGNGDGTGAGSGGNGDGNSGPPSGSGDSGDDTNTATPPPTLSATPLQSPKLTTSPTPTHTPPDTPSPTPKVEPGFNVVTWLVGMLIALGLLALRRQGDQ